MRKIFAFLLLGLGWMGFVTLSLPDAELKDMKGQIVHFSDIIQNDDKPVIVSFWSTSCVPCIKELDAINEVYPDWQDETGVKLVAVSTDDERSKNRIKPMVNGRGWEFDVYHDYKGELKQKLNFFAVPYLIIIHKGKIVYSKSSYTPGSEEKLFEIIRKLN